MTNKCTHELLSDCTEGGLGGAKGIERGQGATLGRVRWAVEFLTRESTNFLCDRKNKTRIKFTTKVLLVVTNSIENFSRSKVKSSKEGVRHTRMLHFLFEKSQQSKINIYCM